MGIIDNFSKAAVFLFLTLFAVSCVSIDRKNVYKDVAHFQRLENRAVLSYWQSFDNDELSRLVSLSLKNNHDIRTAFLNIKEALMEEKAKTTALLPAINLNAAVSKNISKRESAKKVFSKSNLIGLSTKYEIDLWGKIRKGIEITRIGVDASKYAYKTSAITVSSLAASIWANIIANKQKQALIKERIELTKTLADIDKRYYASQYIGIDSLLQAQKSLIQLKLQDENIKKAIELDTNKLRQLVGSKDIQIKSRKLPDNFKNNIEIPIKILSSRPDVELSRLGVKTNILSLRIAKTKWLPQIVLSSDFSYSSSAISNIFKNWMFSLTNSILYALIDYNKRNYDIEISRLKVKAALEKYENTLENAALEARNILVELKSSYKTLNFIKDEISIQTLLYEKSKSDYFGSQTILGDVINKKLQILVLKSELVDADLKLFLNRIELFKVLGGKKGY